MRENRLPWQNRPVAEWPAEAKALFALMGALARRAHDNAAANPIYVTAVGHED